MDLPFKVCPQCGVEYVHSALMCGDCGVSLDLPVSRPAAPERLAAASELQRIAAGGPWEMERLARELQSEGISSRIEATTPADRAVSRSSRRGAAALDAGVGLYVAPNDAERASRILRPFVLPDEADRAEHPPSGSELDACPACGAAISDAATACADCGLEFPVEDPSDV